MLANISALSHVALLYPCQDPFLHLGVDPADATVAQRDRLWEAALPDVLVDGRSGQTGRVNHFFQANNSHKQVSSISLEDERDLNLPASKPSLSRV